MNKYRALRKLLRTSSRARSQFAAFVLALVSLIAGFPYGVAIGGTIWLGLYTYHGLRGRSRPWLLFSDLGDTRPEPYQLLLSDYYYVKPHCLRVLLAENGIHSFILNEALGTMRWKYARATGGVRLYVPVRQYADAAALVLTPDPGGTCPACSYEGASFHAYRTGIAITGAILEVMLPLPKRRWKCHSCGYSWRQVPERD